MKLIDELNAEEGSFLLELRTELNWNHNAFLNLLIKLSEECKKITKKSKLNRNIAEGVWYISYFIQDWSSHTNFPKKFPKEYYIKAYELIHDLASYYFSGHSPYTSVNQFETLFDELTANTKH
ncbi:hypothetical protein [Tenacibaculum xiamenense]|uniref:hypothetical protein n=1 Tax=Tenacibaculum xiamenense TaxID=1261553 RepID=UPI003895FACE